jgi:iron(III) transport system substrate-binding protein
VQPGPSQRGARLFFRPAFVNIAFGVRHLLLACVAILLLVASCSRAPEQTEVVLYSSVDDYLLWDVVNAFEKEHGIRVKVVGDTEATKTTGLVERLLAEKDSPRADVWWSSETFGTIRLSREGVLEPYTSPSTEIAGGWPPELRGPDWTGFGLRARAIAYSSTRLTKVQAPRSIQDLAKPSFKGRIGMARPQFGTTRGHMGYLLMELGEERYRALLEGLKASGVRLYDGNASVVRAIGLGEIDAGLTDTDDVWAAQRNKTPVDIAFEEYTPDFPVGAMRVPNTVALVKGSRHPENAKRLIDFILSEKTERMLVASDSHNMPVRKHVLQDYEQYSIPTTTMPRYEEIAERIPRALAIWDEVIGR